MLFSHVLTVNNFLILLTILIFILYLYFKRSYTYWSQRGVITPSCSFPLGNLNDIALGRVSLHEMFKEFYTELKPKGIKYFGYYFLHQPVLVVFDLELIKSIMVRDFNHFTAHGVFDKNDYDTFGDNLFSLKGDEWRNMREKITPLFTSCKLKMMFPTIENCSTQLASLINQIAENREILDIKDVAGRYTSDIIAAVAFGIEINSLQNAFSDFRKYGERAVGHGGRASELRMAMKFLMPDLISYFRLPHNSPDITNLFIEIVQNTIDYREKNNIVRKDFMQQMIRLKNTVDISDKDNDDCFNLQENHNGKNMENKKDLLSLSFEQIVAQAILFFVAGFDTSSTTIAFCMYELAFQQDIQQKLRDEIETVLKEHDGKLSYDAIMEMTYMDKCIKETLRKYPAISNLFRRCTKSYQVPNSDLVIEKDVIVFFPLNEIHYDPEYYPNPEKFDPERFSSEIISSRNSFAWLPFGDGPRVCLGMRLAMIQMKVALTKLLRDFRYRLDPKTTSPLKIAPQSVMVVAEGGIWLNVEKIIQ